MAKKSGSKFGLFVIIGVAIGWIASLFTPDKVRNQNKKIVQDYSKKLQNLLTDKAQQARIKKIFNKNSKEAQKTYQEVTKNLAGNLADLKVSISKIDKKRYQKALKITLEDFKREQKISTEEFKKLSKYLGEDFKLLTKSPKKSVAKKIAAKTKTTKDKKAK